jgi:hypothetical protein
MPCLSSMPVAPCPGCQRDAVGCRGMPCLSSMPAAPCPGCQWDAGGSFSWMPAASCLGCRRLFGDAGRKLTQCHDKDIQVQEKERGRCLHLSYLSAPLECPMAPCPGCRRLHVPNASGMPAAPCPGCRRHLVPHAGGSGDAGRKLTQCHDKDIRVQEKERGGGACTSLISPSPSRRRRGSGRPCRAPPGRRGRYRPPAGRAMRCRVGESSTEKGEL